MEKIVRGSSVFCRGAWFVAVEELEEGKKWRVERQRGKGYSFVESTDTLIRMTTEERANSVANAVARHESVLKQNFLMKFARRDVRAPDEKEE